MGGGVHCAVPGCGNNSRNAKHVSFFSFPKDEARIKKWADIIGCGDMISIHNAKSKRICSMHFDPFMIISNRLTQIAYPSLGIPGSSSSTINIQHCSTSEDDQMTELQPSASQTRDHINPEQELALATASISLGNSSQFDDPLSLKDIIKEEIIDDEGPMDLIPVVQLSGNADGIPVAAPNFQKSFLNWQRNEEEKVSKEKYKRKEKIFALNLHMACPSVYHLLLKDANLPPVKTLEEMKIIIDPGANAGIIKVLERKIKLLPKKFKYCLLCLNKMKIRKHLYYDIRSDEIIGFSDINGCRRNEIADNAVIMTVKGCIENWIQPIGYGFLGTETNLTDLSAWIFDAIKKLFESGFEICAVVTDQSPMFTGVAKFMGVSREKPFFTVDGIKVFYLFDVPDLYKNIRNNLLQCDFVYNKNKKVKWSYIEDFYKWDKGKEYSLAPKLTDNHLNPKEIHKRKIPYAVQVFSYKVAAGMSILTEYGKLPKEAQGTVDFVLLLNNTLDILNSIKKQFDYKYKAPYKGEDFQFETLKSAFETFGTVKAADNASEEQSTQVETTFTNFQITMKSFTKLAEYLNSQGIKKLYTRRLTRDSMPTIFSPLNIENLHELTPIQFRRQFSKLVITYLIKNSHLGDCEDDLSVFMATGHKNVFEFEKKDRPSPMTVNTIDYRYKLAVGNSLLNVSSYLFKKCKEKHGCSDRAVSKSTQCNEKQVPDGFIKLVQTLEGIFLANFEKCFLDNSIGVANAIWKIINSNKLQYKLPCGFYPMPYLIKIFIRTRIYYALKFIDKHLKQSSPLAI